MPDESRSNMSDVLERFFTMEALEKRPGRIHTGYKKLDALLGGGLAPGLIVLGGSPGLGKSTFAVTLADQISREGTPVTYYSLEMAKERITAKLLVNRNFRNVIAEEDAGEGRQLYSISELDNPELLRKWTPALQRRFRAAFEDARKNRLLSIVDGKLSGRPLSARLIAQDARETAKRTLAENGVRPVIIVDYLQILSSEEGARESERQSVDRSLKEMAALAAEGFTVLLISSMSRGSYQEDLRLEHFKESGGIEFSADVLLGLQYEAVREKGFNADQERKKSPRRLEMKILKQRYGTQGSVSFDYYAGYDTFLESGSVKKLRERAQAATEEKNTAPEARKKESGGKRPADAPERLGYINNTNIMHALTEGAYRTDEWNRSVASRRGKVLYTQFLIEGRLSAFDCMVADALFTLYRTGDRHVSMRALMLALYGADAQLTEERKKRMLESIARMRGTQITIDCTDEMFAMRRSAENEPVILSGPFLDLTDEEPGKGGPRFRFTDGSIHEVMPLYGYAVMTGRLIAFDGARLVMTDERGRRLSDTVENLVLKRYLIYRVETMRYPDSPSAENFRRISFSEEDGLMRTLSTVSVKRGEEETDASWRQTKRRIRERTLRMLDHMKRVGGYVEDYDADERTGAVVLRVKKLPKKKKTEESPADGQQTES